MKQENVFNKIDFINQRIKLKERFNFSLSEAFAKYSNDKVLKIMNELGYSVKYVCNDNYFKIVEKNNNFEFGFNLILKGGFVECVFNVKKGKVPILDYCGSWGGILLKIGYNEPIRKPVFRNYEDLREILKEAFVTYEDFKREVIKEYEQKE
jgi:hypothetical protein